MTAADTMPIASRLGLERGMRIWASDLPAAVRDEVESETLGLSLEAGPSAGLEAVLVFVADAADIRPTLERLSGLLTPSGFAWIGWPESQASDAVGLQDQAGRDWLIDHEPQLLTQGWCAAKLKPRQPSA